MNLHRNTDHSCDDFMDWFYDQYADTLYRLARKYCLNLQDVDDVVQSVWERLIANQESLRGKSRPQQLCYISTAVKNMVRYNARKNRMVFCSLDYVVLSDSSSIENIEESFDRRIRREAFEKLWREVDEDTREILDRKYIHKESDASIARSLGISPDSVRTYLSRARRTAREYLGEHRDALLPNK